MRELIKNNTGLRRTGHNRILLWNNINYKHRHVLKLWSDNYMHLNESWHLHEPELISQYRLLLKDIINQLSGKIINDNSEYEYVIKNNQNQYVEFIFNEPFNNDKILCCLNKIKFYVSFTDELRAFAINDNKEDDKIIDKFLPLIAYNSTRPTIVSIFIHLPYDVQNDIVQIKDCLNKILPHELKHVLDNIYNQISISKQSNINELIIEIEENIESHVNANLILNTGQIVSRDEFLWFISECLYLTEESEMSAYLETAYHEYMNAKDELNLNISETYNEYYKIYTLLIDVIKDKNIYIADFDYEINYILNQLKGLYKINFNTFDNLLLYWEKMFKRFLKNVHTVYFKVKEKK